MARKDHDYMSDKLKSTVNKVKGEAKDQWGNATDDHSLQLEGKADKAKGNIQEAIGEYKEHYDERRL